MNAHQRPAFAGRLSAAASTLALLSFTATTWAGTWTGQSLVPTNLWSDANNWFPTGVPAATDPAIFGDVLGFAGAPGTVNNVVDSNLTVSNLSYTAIAPHYHTTRINPGVTLTVKSPQLTASEIVFGSVVNGLGPDDQMYATIVGPNASLVVGDPAVPRTNHGMTISAQSATAGTHRATMDLSGLDNFTFAGGYFLVGANGGASASDQPNATVLLAKTNLLLLVRSTNSSAQGTFRISYNATGTGSGQENAVELGQDNTIRAEFMKIGGSKAYSGKMYFRASLTNNHPLLRLRAPDGTNRMPLLTIGDNYDATTGVKASGTLDLTGGMVDAQLAAVTVGRNPSAAGTGSGDANGTLILDGGTFDVTTLNVGCQTADNRGAPTGTVIVQGTASLVVSNLNVGRDAGSSQAAAGNGTLTVSGGTVAVWGNVTENDASGGDGSSTINLSGNGVLNLQPPGDPAPGNLTVDTLNVSGGILTNYSTLALNALNLVAPVTDFTVYAGQRLTPAGTSTNLIGTLNVSGGLILSSAILHYDLDNSPAVANDIINVSGPLTLGGNIPVEINIVNGTLGTGDYILMTYGGAVAGGAGNLQIAGPLAASRYTFAFNTGVSPNVVLSVGGTPPTSLTWSGDGAANLWNLTNAVNWNGNSEKFFNLDTVAFDDASSQGNITLAGTLAPAGVLVNSTNAYTFGGSGKITGVTGLIKNGPGTLSLLTANDYTGATAISNGLVLVNGALGDTAIAVNSGAALGGTGTILGSVTVRNGGILAPGGSLGTLAISNNLVCSAASTNLFEVNLDTLAHDAVLGLKSLTYGGVLIITNVGGTAGLGAGAALQLFSASSYAGSFTAIIPPVPATGYVWDLTGLTNGTLRIVATVSTTPTNLSGQVRGGVLDLAWPADHRGWRLESQTNSLGAGLRANWVTVPNSAFTNHVILGVDPNNGAVFYRLAYP